MAAKGFTIAKGADFINFDPALANRHGLIAGATGTGKTITLQTICEQFSNIGVPVFVADVKGDLSGMALAGGNNPKAAARAAELGLEGFAPRACPVCFWDLFGSKGHPVRTTISEMGPLLLARLLDLNETQTGVLNIVFKVADDNGLLLLDLKDLRAALGYVAENASKFTVQYGTVSTASVGAIQRGLLALEQEGADQFFGEPALELGDLLQCAEDGRGIINILAADVLMNKPKIYSTFLLWLLSELFEQLPERGDADKPRLVFFFDEAHLLFKDAPKALTEKIEQVVRLIRSKGVGVYFVSQSPLDIPDAVRGQLGNRVQHALRAFSAAEQKQLKAVAESFRVAKGFDAAEAIMDLGVGEALVSLLDAEGRPAVVERAKIAPPQSFIGPLDDKARAGIIAASPFVAKYTETIDRESAFEKLQQRVEAAPAAKASASQPKAATRQPKEQDSDLEKMVKSIAVGAGRSVARSAGQQIVRGILGSLFR